VAGKINLFINDKTGKVHVLERGSTSFVLCGGRSDGPISIRPFRPAIDIAAENWCSHCIKKILMLVVAGRLYFRPVLDRVLNKPAEKKEAVIDSVRTELIFDKHALEIKILAGKTAGAREDFAIQTQMDLTFDWDDIESLRNLAEIEYAEDVKLTVFSEKRSDEM
jgi:hypothetical protein